MTERVRVAIVRMALQETKNRFFTVVFIKRGDGTERLMNCRLGVSKYTSGGKLGYNARKKKLATVWERKSCKGSDKGYRQIPLENVKEIRFSGNVIKFEHKEK